jgi:hypothetical protein
MRELARTGEVNFDVRAPQEALLGRRWELIMVSEHAINRMIDEIGAEKALEWFRHYEIKIGPNGKVVVV